MLEGNLSFMLQVVPLNIVPLTCSPNLF